MDCAVDGEEYSEALYHMLGPSLAQLTKTHQRANLHG